MIRRSPLKRSTNPIRRKRSKKRMRSIASYIAAKVEVPEDRTGKDPRYLDWVRLQPCVICVHIGKAQTSETQAAHVGEIRGLGQKCPDAETMPLCDCHHQTCKDAHHVLGKLFWPYHGLVREQVIERLRERYLGGYC